MTINNLSDLFLHTLQDIYYAEKQILKALPKLAEKAGHSELKSLLQDHRSETEQQASRLERAFEVLGKPAKAEKCPAIEGIITETNELMDEVEDADTRDAAIIAACQAVEHYEITRYGTLITWASRLGHDEIVTILRDTLAEEEEADAKLTRLAEDQINADAMS